MFSSLILLSALVTHIVIVIVITVSLLSIHFYDVIYSITGFRLIFFGSIFKPNVQVLHLTVTPTTAITLMCNIK